MTTSIEMINATPIEQICSKDYIRLKVVNQRDRYSSMKRPVLMENIGKDKVAAIIERIEDAKYQEAAMRWILRGLETDRAIRKALTDMQVQSWRSVYVERKP